MIISTVVLFRQQSEYHAVQRNVIAMAIYRSEIAHLRPWKKTGTGSGSTILLKQKLVLIPWQGTDDENTFRFKPRTKASSNSKRRREGEERINSFPISLGWGEERLIIVATAISTQTKFWLSIITILRFVCYKGGRVEILSSQVYMIT